MLTKKRQESRPLVTEFRGDFMLKLSPLEKEIHFLYNKHNKETLYPLEIEEIKFPLYIVKILNKATKRTPLETKKLTTFRKKILYELKLKSWHLQYINEEEQEKKRKDRQQKLAQSKDSKYENDPTKIKHFGIWVDTNRLTRENYCIPSNKVHRETKANIKRAQELRAQNIERPLFIMEYYWNIPNDIFADSAHYTDKWVEKHYEDCMKNFDLNMKFFDSLDAAKFQKHLASFFKRNKFIEVSDLQEVNDIRGIYVLVLDEYKQAYVGKSENIKKRILRHWSDKKEFDRLIHGQVDTSVLSIDSFSALDTTRIFYKPVKWYNDIDDVEKKIVAGVNPDYLLNRTAGGLNGETFSSIRNLALIANMKKRKLT